MVLIDDVSSDGLQPDIHVEGDIIGLVLRVCLCVPNKKNIQQEV